jgi:hypothetical protein
MKRRIFDFTAFAAVLMLFINTFLATIPIASAPAITLTLSDAELSTQFAYEWGPGTLTAITDIPGPGVRFDFSGLSPSSGTGVGDNFPVSQLAGGEYKTYGTTQPFSTWGISQRTANIVWSSPTLEQTRLWLILR